MNYSRLVFFEKPGLLRQILHRSQRLNGAWLNKPPASHLNFCITKPSDLNSRGQLQ